MRALTKDEHAMLRGDFRGITFDDDESEGARLSEVSEALILRGCLVRFDSGDGCWGHNITDLGRLALRVSRPEMATGLP